MATFEQEVFVFQLDANLPAKVMDLQKQGWDMIPGTVPAVVYYVMRKRAEAGEQQPGFAAPNMEGTAQPVLDPGKLAEASGFAKLTIDDDKVLTLRDGKLYNSAGTLVDKNGNPIPH